MIKSVFHSLHFCIVSSIAIQINRRTKGDDAGKCRARRRTKAYWRMSRTTTQLCAYRGVELVWIFVWFAIDGKYGEFLSCSNSQCSYTRSLHKSRSQSMRKDCPECDGKLILRNGKHGKFYGCTNYPQCKYTEDYDDV